MLPKRHLVNMARGLCILIGCMSYPVSIFAEEDEPAEPAAQEPPQGLVLSVQYGKGGSIQEFRLKSGEAVFVQTGKPQNPTNQRNPQAEKEMDTYQKQRGQISQKIADKITEIQRKQQEFDSEIYPAYKTPIGVEVQTLERDLKLLEAQREQLESQQIAKESQKPSQPPPPPPPTVASGMTVRASLTGNSASLIVEGQGKEATTTTIQAPINAWVQIFSAEKGQGQDIWAKVVPLGE